MTHYNLVFSFAIIFGQASDAKKELELVVDFLKNPQKYHDIGARLPHGVLLYGPPGNI